VVVFDASTFPIKEGYAVSDSNVIKLAQLGVFLMVQRMLPEAFESSRAPKNGA
jgi:hypothetical protein